MLPEGYRPQLSMLVTRALATVCLTGFVLACGALYVVRALSHCALPVFLAAEALFVLYYLYKLREFNKQPAPHEPQGYDGWEAFTKFVANRKEISRYMSIKNCLSDWFGGAPFDHIKRGNMAELTSYGFFFRSVEQMNAAGLGDLPEKMVVGFEESWGLSFSPGYNPDLRFNAHLWQPVRCFYRPLTFYLTMELLSLMKHLAMLAMGYQCFRVDGQWHYIHGRDMLQAGTTPLLFLHGVGAGLFPYVMFLARLVATGRPVIAIDCPHLSMRLCSTVPTIDSVVKATIAMMDAHNVPKVALVGHSYGTFMCSRMVQLHCNRLECVTLIDPVCCCCFTGKLIRNFVGASPSTLTRVPTWFVARELHAAASVSRNFFWTQLNLWGDQFHPKTLVVLSGGDDLVASEEVRTMVQHETTAQILFHPTHSHAEFLVDFDWQDDLLTATMSMCDAPLAKSTTTCVVHHQKSDSASSFYDSDLPAKLAIPSSCC